MAQVVININNREYPIACENGQETRILQLAQILQQKADLLRDFNGKISESMMLAMIGILVADDLFEARKNPAVVSECETDINPVVAKIINLQDRIKAVAKLVDSL